MAYDLLIKNGKLFLEGGLVEGHIAVKNGRVAALFLAEEEADFAEVAPTQVASAEAAFATADKEYDAGGLLVLPGTVDPHVHVRAPGKEEREDFLSGTAAAAAGGVTTMIEHPIANPPQYNLEILEKRIACAQRQAVVDFAFYGAAGSDFPECVQEMAASGRIVSFKTFLHEAPPGRESEFLGLVMKNDAAQYEGLRNIGKTGMICGVHAENNDMITSNIKRLRENGQVKGCHHAESRPPVTEFETVAKLLLFAEETGARLEFCHVSTPEAMEMIKQAKKRGLDVYAETCPHYLFLDESYLDTFGPFAKCNPPLRDKARAERLWEYVNDGTVDFIGSDHAPYTYEEKQKGLTDIFQSPAGIPCIEIRFPLMMDGVAKGRLSLARMVELLCTNPAKCFGIYPQKGTIRVGSDADFIVVDETQTYRLSTAAMYTKSRASALIFEGMELTGQLKATFVRGRLVMEEGIVDTGCEGRGKLVLPVPKTTSEQKGARL